MDIRSNVVGRYNREYNSGKYVCRLKLDLEGKPIAIKGLLNSLHPIGPGLPRVVGLLLSLGPGAACWQCIG